MKKILLSTFVILAYAGYVIHQKTEQSNIRVIPPRLPSNSFSSLKSPIPTPRQSSPQYKDGTFTGVVTDAFYGPYQVQAVISGGKIVDIIFLQYPNDRRTSIEINTQAMPYLRQEAIQSQSANVDIVTGATQSSLAFRQSLQSALSKAI